MSFEIVTGAPLIVTVNGERHELRKPKRKELGPLYQRWVDEDRQRLKAVLDDAEIAGDERKARMLEFARDSRTAAYPLQCLFLFGRAEETLELAGVDDGVIDAMSGEQRRLIAARMWGFRLDGVSEGEEAEESRPLPEGPSTGA